jgi:hypothetical protein
LLPTASFGGISVIVTPPEVVMVLPQLATPEVWFTPWPVVPVWPVVLVPVSLWASVAKTAPVEETSRQAPIISEVVRCFICALPFKVMLRIEKSRGELRQTVLLIVRWWDVVAGCKHQKGADHPERSKFFSDHVLSGDFR